MIGVNVLEDSFVNVKVNTYDKKCKHITKWLDRMYLYKQDTLRDGVIDAKEIDQWKQILNEYEESLKEITSPKKRREDRFKKDSRTDQSIATTEELNARIEDPMININPPPSNARAYMPYECNKKKNHCMLYIWKHETGIKINFDLWKP